ncbi:hypothetical protein ABZX51_005839 [Aspergillus tubingensis]
MVSGSEYGSHIRAAALVGSSRSSVSASFTQRLMAASRSLDSGIANSLPTQSFAATEEFEIQQLGPDGIFHFESTNGTPTSSISLCSGPVEAASDRVPRFNISCFSGLLILCSSRSWL